jgi:hypothetical protein
MTDYWHQRILVVVLALATSAAISIGSGRPPVAAESGDGHGSVASAAAANPSVRLREMAWIACRERHPASAYLLCEVADVGIRPDARDGKLDRSPAPADHAVPPIQSNATQRLP